ncbi:hypothetical protein ADIARSV_1235 [Arcticibacter svalbardensis MN12-7]|uniref:Uncharacterized protein n=1 Tax=Arcticibacter svalbardensis MN12-7 TaxID=1150600 RepID=R9GUM2_9SPHI|nr:hypothetical protein [Arcticibacter svalbardensis]EOR95552.1 hypothetical protein ADIARSV_1235 [Arcticibacter svalbardensis MN12-7]
MATIDNKGRVRGTAGSVVYRTYRDKNIIQGKPAKFKQTQESIKTSTEFGLSSSTAAIIRQAFEPAYLHRDGTAVSRSTQLVYRSIRNGFSGSVGERDLHDADLSHLNGMEFNADSKLSEVLQMSHQVEQDSEGRVRVKLGSLNTQSGIKRPKGLSAGKLKYRVRLMLVAFNFREEYYEHLEVKDVDFGSYETVDEQAVCFDSIPSPSGILMLSMSLLVYNAIGLDEEAILINSKEFSPCAIIGAFQSTTASDRPKAAVNQCAANYPVEQGNLHHMVYVGNLLMLGLGLRIDLHGSTASKTAQKVNLTARLNETSSGITLGQRVSFKK